MINNGNDKSFSDTQKASEKTMRNSSIELLRIISMLFIVLSHYFVHGSINSEDLSFGFNKLLVDSSNLGKLGVAVFVMITGYFMCKTKFNINRIVSIILQTLFYSITIFVIFCIIDRSNISIMKVLKSFLPITLSSYWFVTAFVVLSLFVPYINKLISNISKGNFIIFILIMVLFWSIAPTFVFFHSMEYGGYLSLLIIFYCVGAYIRIYPYSFLSKKKNALIIFIISFSLLILSSVSIDFLGEKISYFHGMAQKFYSIHSVLVLVIAASMLSLFANMKPFYSKTINTVAGCTFGVYLIHENEFIRKLLWKELFDNSSYAQSKYLILHFIVSALIVYICCTLIELIRKVLLDKYVFKKLSDAISNLINKFLIKIQQIKGN